MYSELLFVLAFASVAAAANTTRCFECTDVPDPYDCLKTTTCAPEQICVVEQFITSGGLVLYNSGCQSRQRCSQSGKRNVRQYSTLSKRADIITCDECCSTDLCNDQGCGKAAPKQPARGPTCFACDVESDPKSCRTIAHCDFGKVCMLSETSHTDGHYTYRSTCETPQVCDAFLTLAVGRKRYTYCHVCCHDDFCNDVCEETVTPAPTTPAPTIHTVQTTTDAPTTTTMPTTTTERPTTATTPPTTTTEKTTTTTTTERTTTTEKPTTQAPVTTTRRGQACHTHAGYKYDPHSHLCYKFHYEHKNWDDANAVCNTEGGTLAIVDTQDKWTFLKAQIENDQHYNGQRIYIGARKLVTTDDFFYWPNGKKIQFYDWAHNQPSRSDGEDCIYLRGHPSTWADVHCDYHNGPFICTQN